MNFNFQDIKKISKLIYLNFTNKQINEFVIKLNNIFSMIKKIRKINTKNIKPMNHPINLYYKTSIHIRNDIFKKNNKYKEYQKLSKNIKNKLYLVPKTIK